MAGTKNYFDQVLENQSKLMTTLSEYMNEAVEMSMPETAATEKAGELLNEYFTRPYELAEEMATKEAMEKYQEDFWGSFTANYTKSIELSMDLYKKTAEYWRNMFTNGNMGNQQERVKKFSEIFQNCMKAYMDTTNANAKAVQEYFNA